MRGECVEACTSLYNASVGTEADISDITTIEMTHLQI